MCGLFHFQRRQTMTTETIGNDSTITCTRVAQSACADFLDAIVGPGFAFELEPAIFHFASMLAESYHGGVWSTFELSSGGFFMAPQDERTYLVRSPNGSHHELSAVGFGICCTLFALSNCSFDSRFGAAQRYAELFHRLQDFAAEQSEASAIFALTD
jgi:hypothetical protein